jgi:hypothetical protein
LALLNVFFESRTFPFLKKDFFNGKLANVDSKHLNRYCFPAVAFAIAIATAFATATKNF